MYHNTHDDAGLTNCNLEPQHLDSVDEHSSSATTLELSNEVDVVSNLTSAADSDVEDVNVTDAELEECEDLHDIPSIYE